MFPPIVRRSAVATGAALLVLTLAQGAAAAPFPSTNWKDIEVVGTESVTVGHNTRLFGSIAVLSNKGLLRVSADVVQVDGVAPDRNFVAASILEFGNGASVQDAYFNRIRSGAGDYYVRGTRQPQSFPLPVATPALPAELGDSCVNFGPDILVDRDRSRVLSPGCYGDVTVRDGGRLELNAGGFKMRSLRLNESVRVIGHGDVDLFVRRAVDIGDDSIVGPESNSPDDLVFWARNDRNTTCHIGRRVRLVGRLVAPNDGNMLLLRDSRITGSVYGRKVHLKQDIDPGSPPLPTPSPATTATPRPTTTASPGPTTPTPSATATPGPGTPTPVPTPTSGLGPPSTPRATPRPTPCTFSPCRGF